MDKKDLIKFYQIQIDDLKLWMEHPALRTKVCEEANLPVVTVEEAERKITELEAKIEELS